jgi:putative ABC transport system substrate-binding protein
VKWLELLNQIAPQVTRTAVIYDPTNPEVKGFLPVIEAAARSFGMQLSIAAVRDAAEIEHAIEEFARGGCVVRTHLALGKDAPLSRAVQRTGVVVAIPILSGLHHHYVRIGFSESTGHRASVH